jgi:hypothetical protein
LGHPKYAATPKENFEKDTFAFQEAKSPFIHSLPRKRITFLYKENTKTLIKTLTNPQYLKILSKPKDSCSFGVAINKEVKIKLV